MEPNEIFEEGGEGNFVADGAWIPEEHKGVESLKNITNFGDLVKGFVNAQHTIGKKGVIIPGEGASEEEIGAFHTALGRPEKPESYEFGKPELPEGMETDEKMEATFRDIAHKNGLNNVQASAIVDGINKYMIDGFNANNKATQDNQKESMDLLKKTWGKDADANMELASRAFKSFVPDEAKQAMLGKLGDNPALIEAFLAVGKGMSEGKMVGVGELGASVDASKKLAEIMNNKEHPYFNAKAPGHKEAVAEVQKINDILHPESEKE